MASALDQKYDAVLAAVVGEGGRLKIGQDAEGRAIVTNFPDNFPLFFKTFCALNGETEAIVTPAERLTFAELDQLSDRLATALVARGIRKGDRVAIAMKNCAAWVVSYMAVLKAGGIATLMNGWWQRRELEHAFTLTEPALTLADAPRAERIREIEGEWKVETIDIYAPVEEGLAELLKKASADVALPEVSGDDDATILFTSGSTGEAKGALSTHRQVITGVYAYALSLMVLLGILQSENRPPKNPPKTLLSVPLFHVTGEVPVLLNSFVVGRTMVLMDRWDAEEAMRLIEKEKVTYFIGVPTMSLELMNHPDREKYDLSSLTDVAAGGAPRPVAHVKRLQEEMGDSQPALGYGLTETNAVGCTNFWDNYGAKPKSTGRPQHPLVELKIIDDQGNELPVGGVGEICIRSAASIKGYWRNPAATKAAFTEDGYLKTGDIGMLDEDGYLYIVDRKKDIIIRGGENIAAAEVEAAIYAHEAVAEAAVFGVADDRLGEVPIAILHLHEGQQLSADEMCEFLSDKLAAFKIPDRILFVDKPLPRLGTGKIDRVRLKSDYGG
ncbi:class I adenylate-forming enzyme family protein [Sphingomicrobium lutaoense]|uniref:3-methylmercaptopropionyl-CoA ligase n=1 Tax=Sphingomicrobium lutaoense TaxID=515949 RepID=A0A839YWF6_9SPHN|nr:class I adenylate-forming enzyme family protein [Sphingomicrobium lutaoense]MBB3764541.1 acyl-CoA synthetase (AMP-forming)/AMP-acid ligase II [Sphingomicrobium lutaoense]